MEKMDRDGTSPVFSEVKTLAIQGPLMGYLPDYWVQACECNDGILKTFGED